MSTTVHSDVLEPSIKTTKAHYPSSNKNNSNSYFYQRHGIDSSMAATADVYEADDFMMRFVDGTCQGIFPDEPCSGGMLPACNARLEHQLDLLTVCILVLLLLLLHVANVSKRRMNPTHSCCFSVSLAAL